MTKPTHIYVIRKDRIPANGICPIYLRYIYKSVWKDIPTGLRVYYKHWSSESGAPTLTCDDRDTILQRMNDYSIIVKNIIADRIANVESLMPIDVKPEIVAKFNSQAIIHPTRPTVEQAFNQFINFIKSEVKPATIQTYETMMNVHLKPYCEENARVLSWSLFGMDFGAEWKQYFITKKKQDTTAGKYFRRLHTFLKWASAKNYLGTNYFREWGRIKEKSNVPIVCSEDDLLKLKKYANNPEKKDDLRMITDMFVFLCNTGLRIGDFLNLRYRNLHHEQSGKGTRTERYLLKIHSEKTEIPLTIPLTDDAFELIIQYNPDLKATATVYTYKPDDPNASGVGFSYQVNPVINQHPNRRLFPKVYQQDINEQIKKIGEDCGIDSSYERIERYGAVKNKVYKPKYALLTCHTARRTFITIALQSGIQVPVIMKYTGHTSFKSIARYFAISQEYMFQQMEKFGSKDAQQTQKQMEQSFRSTFY